MTTDAESTGSKFTIYTMGDSNYFVGIVALINSLFITMDDGELSVVVLDLGLDSRQRDILAPHCRVLNRTSALHAHPWYLTPFAYLDEPKGTIAIIDSDIIVTRSLDQILGNASGGSICVFPDPDADRWFASWAELFSLQRPLRPKQTYLNAGFVSLSVDRHPDFLRRWWETSQKISQDDLASGVADPALKYASQDTLNALLLSEFSPEDVEILPTGSVRYSPDQMAQVHISDITTLACLSDGDPVNILHSIGAPKAWQRAARLSVRRTAFLRLLRRVLLADDVRIRLEDTDLPPWLRNGPYGRAALWYHYGINFGLRCVRSGRYQLGRAFRDTRRRPS
jgi:hypothetical protein